LVIDGIENAERNVLPTLNNLLENREMALEDGRFLMNTDLLTHSSSADLIGSRIVSVHPDFRVIALGKCFSEVLSSFHLDVQPLSLGSKSS